jgi:hypothetical protein
MISTEILHKGLYFDIETVGLYNTLEELQKENPKLATLWSKRCKWLRPHSGEEFADATDADLWKEKSSLHPEFGKIVCVSFGAFDDKKELVIRSFTGDEKQILLDTNKVFGNSLQKGLRLAGHTIKNFDIPFLGKRMIINGVRPSDMINFFNKKPWEANLMDLNGIFAFGGFGQTHISLDLMCTVLGVDSPKIGMDGSKVHSEYYAGNIEEIKKYCEMDVFSAVECFQKFSF